MIIDTDSKTLIGGDDDLYRRYHKGNLRKRDEVGHGRYVGR